MALMQAAMAAEGKVGLKVNDVEPEKLADKIYYIPARQGKFPSVENKAFFTNIMFIVVMEGRMAGMGDGEGSFIKGIETLKAIKSAMPSKIFFPAHGNPGKQLVDEEIELFETVYSNAATAQKAGKGISDASAAAKATPFMKAYAKKTEGFDHGLGQWITIAYQEAESANF